MIDVERPGLRIVPGQVPQALDDRLRGSSGRCPFIVPRSAVGEWQVT